MTAALAADILVVVKSIVCFDKRNTKVTEESVI